MAKPLTVDFTGVESGGRIRVPEDDYKVRVKSVKHDTSKSGNSMLVWELEITEGKFSGKVLKEYTVLNEKNLWKLKNLLEAMGVTVPNKRVALKLANYLGKELGVTVVDDENNGRISSNVADFISVDVLDADEEEEDLEEEDVEEEPTPKAKKGKKGKKGKKSKKPAEDEEEIEDLDLDEI